MVELCHKRKSSSCQPQIDRRISHKLSFIVISQTLSYIRVPMPPSKQSPVLRLPCLRNSVPTTDSEEESTVQRSSMAARPEQTRTARRRRWRWTWPVPRWRLAGGVRAFLDGSISGQALGRGERGRGEEHTLDTAQCGCGEGEREERCECEEGELHDGGCVVL